VLPIHNLAVAVTPPVNPHLQRSLYAAIAARIAKPFCAIPWEFAGFSKQVHDLILQGGDEFFEEYQCDFVPDAFYFDYEKRCAYVLEIVKSNDISDEKAEKLCTAWWLFDAVYWDFVVVLHYPKVCKTVYVPDMVSLDSLATTYGDYGKAFDLLRRDAADPAILPVTGRIIGVIQ
jgi:hypothetical protein